MNKNVMVSLLGEHVSEEGGLPIEVTTCGEYYFEDGMHCIKYDEIAEEEGQVTTILLKAGDEAVEMIRSGFTNAQMFFAVGEPHVTSYELPFGILNMTTNTTDITVDAKDEEINIDIRYELSMNDEHVSDNTMKIRVTNV